MPHPPCGEQTPQQAAKINLTAALRWADRLGLGEGVCNHFSLSAPGAQDQYLINPQGLHWSEVTASDIVTVDPQGNILDGKGAVEPAAFFIHSRIYLKAPATKCVLHTHMPYATALCALADNRLKWCNQNALRFYGQIAYEDEFKGLATDEAEGDRIAMKLVEKRILFLANHGVVTTGAHIAKAFDDLYYLERAAMTQVLACSTGQELKIVPDQIAALTYRQFEAQSHQARLHFEAVKRVLEREAPEFTR